MKNFFQGVRRGLIGACLFTLMAGNAATGQDNSREFQAFSPTLKAGRIKATHTGKATDNVSISETVSNGRPGLKVAWHDLSNGLIRLHMIRDYVPLDFYSCRIRMNLYLPDPAAFHDSLYLVLEDRLGEQFELQQRIQPVSGWQTITFELHTGKIYPKCWGGDKRLDAPLLLRQINFGIKQPAGMIVLGEVTGEILSAPCIAEIVTGNPIHILRADRDDRPELLLRNYNTRTLNLHGKCTIKDADGKNVEVIPVPEKLDAGASVRIPLPEPSGFGIFYCTLELDDGIAPPVTRTMSYARMLPAGPTPGVSTGFHFAVHSHADIGTVGARDLSALAAGMCGAKVFRTGTNWDIKENGSCDWTVADQLLDAFGAQGLEPQFQCGGWLPEWALDLEKPLFRDFGGDPRRMDYARFPKLDKWGKMITLLLEHFRGRVRFVEPWNEPDLAYFANFSVEDYCRLQKYFYETVKHADPSVKVMTGGFALLNVNEPRHAVHPDYLREALRGSRGFYDIIAFHGHGPQQMYRTQISGLSRIRQEVGVADTPWWSNETAISSAAIGERAQAETLFKKLLYCWANGGVGYTWYNIRNKGYLPNDGEHNFGLVTKDFYPKQVYLTYNMLAGLYRNAEFLRTLNDANEFQVYLFRAANGDYLVPSWNVNGSHFNLLVLSNITGKVSIIDIFGNETEISTSSGLCLIPAGHAPQTVRISGQKEEPGYVSDFIEFPKRIYVRNDQEDVNLTVKFHNPLRTELSGVIRLKAPENGTVQPQQQELRLAPGQAATLDFQLKLTPDPSGSALMRKIPCSIKLGEMIGEFHMELYSVRKIKPDFQSVPDFVLNKSEQVLPRFLNVPGNAHLIWQGPQDLSAEIHLALDEKFFRIKYVVKDDVFTQNFRDADLWKGDSVQLNLWLPGQADMWEIGASRNGDGTSGKWVWEAPSWQLKLAMIEKMQVETSWNPENSTMTYVIALPLDVLGVTPEMRGKPFPIGVQVNDNDGSVRESSMLTAPQFGGSMRITDHAPLIIFD